MAGQALRAIKADRSITDQVRESIRSAIIDGELAPGSLHSVQALADVLGVSRTPVREALIDLGRHGMVRFERNRGVRILQTSIHELEEILTLRLLLEVPSAHRAAGQASKTAVSAMRNALAAMEKAAARDDEPALMEHDRRFHQAIHAMSGNRRLAEYVDSLRDLVLMRGISTGGRSRSLDQIVDEHREILAAIESGDAERARSAMKRHLVSTALLLLEQEGGRDAETGLPWAADVPG